MRLICWALWAAAELAGQEISVRPLWKVGDTIRLEYKRTREDARRPESNGTSTTPITIRVLAAGTDGYRVLWSMGKTELSAGQHIPPAVMALQEKVSAMQMEIQLSADGEYQKLVNSTDVIAKMGAMMDQLLPSITKDEAEQKKLREFMSPELLLASAEGDAKTYFGMYGVALEVGETVTAPMTQPFPLAPGQTVAAQFAVRLAKADDKAALLRSETSYDAASLKTAMNEMLKKAGVPEAALDKMPTLDLADEGEYEVDRRTGTIARMSTVRRIKAEGIVGRMDRREFRVLP
jgi:hypothetical protein